MAEKRNIFLVGPMGAGKSTIGCQSAQQLNMEFYDSDQEIEKRTGADVGWVFDLEGEEGFRDREEKVINELTEKQGIVLATGGGSVKSRETRNRLSARGVCPFILKRPSKSNLHARSVIKNARCCTLKHRRVKFRKRWPMKRNPLYEEIADVTIRTDDQSAKVVANQIIHMLESN
ncbi:shikimate kinase AroK [Escherichia coli]